MCHPVIGLKIAVDVELRRLQGAAQQSQTSGRERVREKKGGNGGCEKKGAGPLLALGSLGRTKLHHHEARVTPTLGAETSCWMGPLIDLCPLSPSF